MRIIPAITCLLVTETTGQCFDGVNHALKNFDTTFCDLERQLGAIERDTDRLKDGQADHLACLDYLKEPTCEKVEVNFQLPYIPLYFSLDFLPPAWTMTEAVNYLHSTYPLLANFDFLNETFDFVDLIGYYYCLDLNGDPANKLWFYYENDITMQYALDKTTAPYYSQECEIYLTLCKAPVLPG